jgi:hypothetical protein
MSHKTKPLSLYQATQNSPTLARLCELAAESSACLKIIEPLLPTTIRPWVKPGPIDDTHWCLIVSSNAIASKVRQLIPALESRLQSSGKAVGSIRLKVQTSAFPKIG